MPVRLSFQVRFSLCPLFRACVLIRDSRINVYVLYILVHTYKKTTPDIYSYSRLFCPLAKSELKYTKRSALDPQHPPMFACITRTNSKVTNDKDVLECHGFICSSTEEAVSIAAQLYQALIDTIKAQGVNKKASDICF